MDQLSFASLDFAVKKKRTRRDVFLAEMTAVVPWGALEEVIAPHYPKIGPKGGRRPFPLATMLRIYCLQQWYNLSDPGAEEALYDIQSMRTFCGLELGRDAIPDETTILNFRHLLERHALTKAIFAAVAEHLEAKGEMLRVGPIVDATLIAASPSTKNKQQKRDPEMSSSKKGNQWYFGMKAHVGVDAESGLVHTAGVTTGKVHDAKVMHRLIREDDRAVYGDKGYANDEKRRAAEDAGVLWPRRKRPSRAVNSRSVSVLAIAVSARSAPRPSTSSALSNASSAIARCATAASRRTARSCSPFSRSPTFSSLATDLRPHEGKRGRHAPSSAARAAQARQFRQNCRRALMPRSDDPAIQSFPK